MARFKIAAKYFLYLLVVLFIQHCANQLPPGGGEIDLVSPKIISVYPADGTINYSENYFEIEFSEYVDKRSVREAVFISPALEGSIVLDWSGRAVRIEFPEALRENTTYNITIGTDVSDFNNRNRMAEAFNFSFSTGSNLDKRVVTGRIFTEKPQGIMLFAYLNPADTTNPSRNKPDYISQSGIDGKYKIAGLAAGKYRIFAVQDEFRDLLYNSEQDKIGIPHKEIILSETDSLYSGLDFFLFAVDTVKPHMVNAVMTDKYHLVLSFSEELNDSSISSNNFYIFDSTFNRRIKPVFAYRNLNKPAEVFLAIKDSIPETNSAYVFSNSVTDRERNTIESEVVNVIVSGRPDTLKPMINKMQPVTGNKNSDYQNQVFSFYFNDGVDSSTVKKNTVMSDTAGRKINFNIYFSDDATFHISPQNYLEPSKDYMIKIDLRNIKDAAGNKTDTIFVYRFKTISGLEFTGISGNTAGFEFSQRPVLVLQGTDEKKISYQQNISNMKFAFERIEPGTYRLWGFYDNDSTFTYSKGSHYPFLPSENFTFYKDTLQLRPRWAITDILFNFGK